MTGNQAHPPAWAVFTDGSCWAKDRIGGWAWVAFNTEYEGLDAQAVKSGGAEDTTISRMELMGPIDFLEWLLDLQGPSWVLVYSDSEYVVKGITNRGRARNMHHDLWNRLDAATDAHLDVRFEHVKGHHESFYNHEADLLAGKARKDFRREQTTT